jgi:hypothetical protein
VLKTSTILASASHRYRFAAPGSPCFAQELAQLLEQGHTDRLTSLKTMARFHRYSLNNVCLIVAQRPTATRVAGYHTWRSIGRFVRKGEKGIAILAPILRRRRDETDEKSRGSSQDFAPPTSSMSNRRTAHRCRNRPKLEAIPVRQLPDSGQRSRRTGSLSSTQTIWAARLACRAVDGFE